MRHETRTYKTITLAKVGEFWNEMFKGVAPHLGKVFKKQLSKQFLRDSLTNCHDQQRLEIDKSQTTFDDD